MGSMSSKINSNHSINWFLELLDEIAALSLAKTSLGRNGGRIEREAGCLLKNDGHKENIYR